MILKAKQPRKSQCGLGQHGAPLCTTVHYFSNASMLHQTLPGHWEFVYNMIMLVHAHNKKSKWVLKEWAARIFSATAVFSKFGILKKPGHTKLKR